MLIDPKQPVPLYFQLKTLLLEAMLGGEYAPGDRLPTEQELCKRFGISRTPVNRALSELAEEGAILRYRRRGTFVNPHWIPRYPDRPEVRVVVPEEGPWDWMVRDAAPPDADINVITVPRSDLHHALIHAVAEGQAPDLAVLDSVWLPEFAAAGFLRALDTLDERWVLNAHGADFLESLVAANRYEGRSFAVPAVANVAGFWYYRRPLEALGLKAPVTWDDLRTVAKAIAAEGLPHPIVMPGGSKGTETTAYCLIAFLASNGASVLQAGGVNLDSPATVEALTFLRGLVDEGLIPVEAVRYEWNRPVRLLAQGHAVFSFGGSYEAGELAESLGVTLDKLWDHVGFIAVPAGPRGQVASVAGTMVYGVFRQAAYPKLAMRLLEHLVAPEVLVRISEATGRIPPRRSAIALAARDSPFLSLTAEILDRAVTRPATPLYPRVSAQLQVMLEAVLTGRHTPQAAARRAAEMIGAITGLPVRHDQETT